MKKFLQMILQFSYMMNEGDIGYCVNEIEIAHTKNEKSSSRFPLNDIEIFFFFSSAFFVFVDLETT